jgi:hypothetical protein
MAMYIEDLSPSELESVGMDVQSHGTVVAYAYTLKHGLAVSPSQHRQLMVMHRSLGRMLTDAEFASVVGTEGGDDAHH